MTILQSFWTPCMWLNSVRTGSQVVAFYTMSISVVLITLVSYNMRGGESTQLYNPLFEADIRYSMQGVGGFFIAFFSLLIISAALMLHGINRSVRGWLLPWSILWFVVCLFQLIFGLWLLGGYYIYLQSVTATLCNWLWMSYNIYCWLCVLSMYRIFAKEQSPNIEQLWP